jgi:hypothetical protein
MKNTNDYIHFIDFWVKLFDYCCHCDKTHVHNQMHPSFIMRSIIPSVIDILLNLDIDVRLQ